MYKKNRVKIIADLSSNHMGDIGLAKQMIQKSAAVGVDIVKVQSWQAEKLSKFFKGDYTSTYERHKKAQLTDDDHLELINWCNKNNIEFLTTCFDLDRIEFLASLGLKTIKIASSDCTSTKLLKKIMDHFDTILISTGMTHSEEIQNTIRLLNGHDYIMLHCMSIYPTPLNQCNLSRINWLKKHGVNRVGFSDHSLGTEASMAAMTMGIEVIEKHLTLDRTLPGKDQQMSTTPEEFQKICAWRDLCQKMFGDEKPHLSNEEINLRSIYIGKWGDNK
nr:N-acetylneuraminate synthase family protein [uncultured Methanoregula sp.]